MVDDGSSGISPRCRNISSDLARKLITWEEAPHSGIARLTIALVSS
jgi:hypothetical protein